MSSHSLDLFADHELKEIKIIFFDIDDTFSSHGQISAEAYNALWLLKKSGLILVPVTGRPAGWCDMIARMWPVTAVVGENGAFYMMMKKGKLEKKYLEPAATRLQNQKKLLKLRQALQKKYKNLSFASDQLYREFDLAIDYCEDVKPWKEAEVAKLIEFCRDKGAIAKLSSIHVNTWFGQYDKLTCVKKFISEELKITEKSALTKSVYLGDSPNDEPFFKAFPLTIGVANVRKFLKNMTHPPLYITKAEAGLGYTEFAKRLLAARQK